MKAKILFDEITEKIGFKPTQQAIANILNVRQSVIGNRITRNSDFKVDELIKIQRHYGINLTQECLSDNICYLDYYPNVFGSCGRGCVVFDESKEKISVTKDLIKNYSNSKKYSVISACGCSMSPTIEDGDKLIVEHFENSQIKDNRVYIFEYKNELFIKRLVKNIDQIICISENKDFENRIITDLKQFKIIGEIVGLYREKV